MFLLLEKYYNNGSFDLVMDIAIDSNDLHFMVLLMHSACTQHKCINTKHNNIIVKYINIGNVATLALGSRPNQGLAKMWAKSEAWESHFILSGV
jgi:hypothetical protein